MRKITCDCCNCDLLESEVIKLTEFTLYVTAFVSMKNPDLCFHCVDNLKKYIEESIIQWKLKKGQINE